jgi:uncharacterized protein (DUF2132 family)
MIHLSGMYAAGPKNPLHGITLEKMVTDLQAFYGWEMLGRMIKVNCFNWQPSVKSSLTFLRKTPWARQKVEELYIDTLPDLKAVAEGRMAPLTDEGHETADPSETIPKEEITSLAEPEETAHDREASQDATEGKS